VCIRDSPAPALRAAFTRACGTALTATGMPRALGPTLRRASVRLSRAGSADPAPYALVRRTYGTSRSARALLAEHATYADVAAQLVYVRRQFTLPAGLPVTVLAAGAERRWLERQRALAGRLGAEFRTSPEAGHLVMLDRPHDVARAVLDLDLGPATRPAP
ncbi:alpha/beta hydrolase, partial [Streptomyces sp. YC537]|nr:alpha/beta hydrolase [Streptomyces boluensis]